MIDDVPRLPGPIEAARHLLESGKAADALAILDAVDDMRWKHAAYWAVRAWALIVLERSEQAVEAANWGLSIEPFSAQLYALRFEGEWASGAPGAAERSILEAIRLGEGHPAFVSRYADLLAGVGQVDKAAAVNADARRRAPDDLKLTLQAANLAYLQGDDTSALASARRAVQLAPDDAAAQFTLGFITEEVVGSVEATPPLRRALELGLPGAGLRDMVQSSVAVSSHPAVRPYYAIVEAIGPARVLLLYGIPLLLLLGFNYWKAALALFALFWLTQGYVFVAERLVARQHQKRLRQDAAGDVSQ